MTRRAALGLLAAAFVAYLTYCGVVLLRARDDLLEAVDVVERVRDSAQLGDVAEGRPVPDLRAAEERFARARRAVRSPVVSPLRALPVVGRQLRSVDALSGAARTITAAGAAAVEQTARAIGERARTPDRRLAALRRTAGAVDRVADAVASVDLGPSDALLSPLARARNRLASELAELRRSLRTADDGLRAMTDLLGGPRRYLVLAANNAEMRAGAGMFLQAGVLSTSGGRLELSDMVSTGDVTVPRGSVPVEGDLAARWGWQDPVVDLRNLMLSPRFDVSAPLAARMWAAAGRGEVDGVLVLDPAAFAGILRAIGPVESAGQRYDGDTAIDELLYGQYQRSGSRADRHDELGGLTAAVFAAVDAGDWDASVLADELARAARGRHVLAWSRHQTEQRGWHALGVHGMLDSESLMVALNSRAGNKLDRWLTVTADLTRVPAGDHTEFRLALTLENRPPDGAVRYVMGPSPRSTLAAGMYSAVLAVSVPGTAGWASMDGVGSLAVAGRDGPTLVAGAVVDVARGERRTIVVHFGLRGAHGSFRVEPSARIPPVQWQYSGNKWEDSAARRVNY